METNAPHASEPSRGNGEIPFLVRTIHNQIKAVIARGDPGTDKKPQSQLQGGILGYLFHHGEENVYQKDLERAFGISGATASNTLQVMEKNGLIVRTALEKDARLKRIQMTQEAAAGHARMECYMRALEQRMLEDMTDGEVAELARLLHVLKDNLERLKEATPRKDTMESNRSMSTGEKRPEINHRTRRKE